MASKVAIMIADTATRNVAQLGALEIEFFFSSPSPSPLHFCNVENSISYPPSPPSFSPTEHAQCPRSTTLCPDRNYFCIRPDISINRLDIDPCCSIFIPPPVGLPPFHKECTFRDEWGRTYTDRSAIGKSRFRYSRLYTGTLMLIPQRVPYPIATPYFAAQFFAANGKPVKKRR